MSISEPAQLLSFIDNVSIDQSGDLILNGVSFPSFTTSYTPVLSVSYVSQQVFQSIGTDILPDYTSTLDSSNLIIRINDSSIQSRSLAIYSLLQVVILESFSFSYLFEEDSDLLNYVHDNDFTAIRNNIHYLIDYFGYSPTDTPFESYISFIPDMRNLDISFGYLQAQLNILTGKFLQL